MNARAPFLASDLEELDARLLSRAFAVVPMRDVYHGNTHSGVLALRHDVDDNAGSLDTALAMAEWEHERGYASTYFLLHDSHYWQDAPDAARELVALGHEAALHCNAIAEAIKQGRSPHDILTEALHELRSAVPVIGTVAHGDALCRDSSGAVRFTNDELFWECQRPALGAPDRTVAGVKLEPRSMWDYGLKYDANWLSRGEYLSDSGGKWSRSFDDVAAGFPFAGQLHVLQHPDHWGTAWTRLEVAA